MKKKLSKFFIIMVAIGLALILLSTTQVQAAIQSNPNTHYKKIDTPTNWMTNFRNMEITGGALGLTETINGTTKLATSDSNNLDSHMMKSTEYGAIAILSASGYGNSKTLQASTIKSTTGNETGVYINGSSEEWVAGGMSGYIFSGVNGRYYDAYTTSNSSAKVGDALGTASTPNPGCAGWHSAVMKNWFDNLHPYFVRNVSTGLFAFYGSGSIEHYSHGVVVCGEGL